MKETKQHNYGIDLLRVVATFMICVLHMLGRGGLIASTPFLSVSYEVVWLLETLALCSVNCYGLISGYVGYKSKYRYARIVELWLTAVLVQLVFTVVQAIAMPETITFIDIVKIVFPIMTRQYWYLSSFAVVFLLMPVLNLAVEKLEKKQLKVLLITLCAVFCISGTFFRNSLFFDDIWNADNEPFGLLDGYSGLWLSVLYLIGAYYKRYGFPEILTKKNAVIGYFISTVLAWAIRIPIDIITNNSTNRMAYFYFASYLSPLMLIAGICLLAAFSKKYVPYGLKKAVQFLSPLTFGIYLIQVNPFLWKNVVRNLLYDFGESGVITIVAVTLGAAIGTFIICALIDLPRHFLFKALKLPKRLSTLENKLIGNFWNKKDEQ